jgi:hypothetical protein
MSVVITPNSRLAHDLNKFEQHPNTPFKAIDDEGDTLPVGNPYQFRPYPMMLYKASKGSDGIFRCLEDEPDPLLFEKPDAFQRAVDRTRRANEAATMIVGSKDEEEKARGNGWRRNPTEAMDFCKGLEDDMARAAAEAAASVRKMSPKAQDEYTAAEAASAEHVTDVTPESKRKARA